ncbi:MAG: holo-ACP synthase [Rhodospirillales bacterium]|nr:holo-ACP synthase [Rhodospirillales bacterium]
MILGLGTDLCDIRRIESTVERFGERFLVRVYTPVERAKADRRQNPAAVLAQCFAAKEACTKALGTGLRRGVFLKDIEVRNERSGKPYLELSGGAADRMREMIPPGMEAQLDVSMSDEYPLAHAVVILSANSVDR